MTDLDSSYRAWRGAPMPAGSANDDLDEVHADLVAADALVADLVVPFVERGVRTRTPVDVVQSLRSLRERAIELAGELHGDDVVTAESYRRYADLLTQVYVQFVAVCDPRP